MHPVNSRNEEMITMEGSFDHGKSSFNHSSHPADRAIPALILDSQGMTPGSPFHGFID